MCRLQFDHLKWALKDEIPHMAPIEQRCAELSEQKQREINPSKQNKEFERYSKTWVSICRERCGILL